MSAVVSNRGDRVFQSLRREILFITAGVSFACGSLLPGGLLCAVLGWVSAILLILAARRSREPLHGWFYFGLVFHALAFYWLAYTIVYFGSFPTPLAVLVFLLFCFASSLQFLCCGWIAQKLKGTLFARASLSVPLAWLTTEFLFPRLFPWALGHTQIAFTCFAVYAQWFGVYPLAFFMLWATQLVVDGGVKRIAVVALFIGVAVWHGRTSAHSIAEQLSAQEKIKIGIVQGNLEAKQKRDSLLLAANVHVYRQLSEQAVGDGAQLLIWPESVITKWTNEQVKRIDAAASFSPFPNAPVPLLYGGLSYRLPSLPEIEQAKKTLNANVDIEDVIQSATKYFNTGFGIDEKGQILGHYHKKVLMPFGEFIPLADRFPILKELSPQTGDFTPGNIDSPISFSLAQNQQLQISVLICYEDLIPELSADGVKNGGELLVNLTNDAWYGDTAAPHQHNMLAVWRAIETGRYLVRATNTGTTTVVDPLGRTILELPVFKPGYGVVEIAPQKTITPYVRMGDRGTQVAVLITVIVALFGVIKGRFTSNEASI